MNKSTSQATNIGRFLLLAAFLPGLVYTFALFFNFPDQAIKFDCLMRKFRFESTWLAWTALTIVIGLILSSICFAIELLGQKSKKFSNLFPRIQVSKLALIEAKGESTSYLNQLLGQAFMHCNILFGFCLIFIVWLFFGMGAFNISAWAVPNIVKLLIGLFVIAANFIINKNLYDWAQKVLNEVEQFLSRSESEGTEKQGGK